MWVFAHQREVRGQRSQKEWTLQRRMRDYRGKVWGSVREAAGWGRGKSCNVNVAFGADMEFGMGALIMFDYGQ